MKRTLSLLFAAGLALSACVTDDNNPNAGIDNTTIGTLAGAGLGALLGAQFGKGSGQWIAGAVGAVAGGFIGNQIGKKLDEADARKRAAATQQATVAPVGQEITWSSPEKNTSGTILAKSETHDNQGRTCRRIEETVNIAGQIEKAEATLCLNPDGTWERQA